MPTPRLSLELKHSSRLTAPLCQRTPTRSFVAVIRCGHWKQGATYMRITEVEIKHYRSILSLRFHVGESSLICGPNSCGKSNVLRALKLAFLPSYDAERMALNVSHFATSPNAATKIKLTFDKPTPSLANALGIASDDPFTYTTQIKRSGKFESYLNGVQLTVERRRKILDAVLVVHVPPIRDLTAGGLDPFKETLANVIRKGRGSNSLAQLNTRVKAAVTSSGRSFLAGTQSTARGLLRVDELAIDADTIELDSLLPMAGIKFKVNGRASSLDKLGTGHQSSVILSLYRQLGIATGKYVLYLFEEPDNHLHPTSLRAIADDIKSCVKDDCQAFVTTHSPYLINQFPIGALLCLSTAADRSTVRRKQDLRRTDHELRIAIGKYGLKPSEALLCKKVVLVEGPSDVALLRTLIEIESGLSPDRQDILLIPAGGKGPLADLCLLFTELGVNWLAFFDWDATEDTRQPIFQDGMTAIEIADVQAALGTVFAKLRSRGYRQSTTQKTIANLIDQVAQPAQITNDFLHSVLGQYLTKSKALSTAEISRLKSAIRYRRKTVIRDILKPANIWLWRDIPEVLLLNSSQAEATVEALLLQHGILQAAPAANVRRVVLINKLHDLGHHPALLEEVVRALWTAGDLNRPEIRQAVRHAIA